MSPQAPVCVMCNRPYWPGSAEGMCAFCQPAYRAGRRDGITEALVIVREALEGGSDGNAR